MIELDPDRRLALAYAPAHARPALGALWRLDVTLGAILSGRRDPIAKQLRLAWWREALERLDLEAAPPEPVLASAKAHLLPAGVPGAELASIGEGWEQLLADPVDLDAYAAARGGALFALSARLLGGPGVPVDQAGEMWALADLARHSARPEEARTALEAARARAAPAKWPKPLRPLGMLAMLAARDCDSVSSSWERPGAPARMLLMVRHRLTGH